MHFKNDQNLESQSGHARVGNEFKEFFVDIFYRIYEYFINTADKELEEDKAAEEQEIEGEVGETTEGELEADQQEGE